jgi:nitrous oxide reductase
MSSDHDGKAAARRRFLKLASLGAVAGTVATAAGTAVKDAAAAAPEPEGKGYRETAHVKRVYELARF